jgi:hypothetical protein
VRGQQVTAFPTATGGRKPYPLETMLRIHLLQNWLSLSDPTMEALYEITPIRQSARLTLSAPTSEDTTIMTFGSCWKYINWPMRSSPSSMVICRKKAYPYVSCVNVVNGFKHFFSCLTGSNAAFQRFLENLRFIGGLPTPGLLFHRQMQPSSHRAIG